jgi:hypothetical protein
MFQVRQGRYQLVIQDLHKKYGPVVRIAPNVLDLDFPELIKTIYNAKEEYLKASPINPQPRVLLTLYNRRNSIMVVVPKAMEKSSIIYSANVLRRSMLSKSDLSPCTIPLRE